MLASIENCLEETDKFLKACAEDKRKKDCLEAFAECQNIVAWIKIITTGEQQISSLNLVTFVTMFVQM